MDVSTRRVSAVLALTGIRSLVRFGRVLAPLAHPVLYPLEPQLEAIPKYISRRTSYFRVWLAFHP